MGLRQNRSAGAPAVAHGDIQPRCTQGALGQRNYQRPGRRHGFASTGSFPRSARRDEWARADERENADPRRIGPYLTAHAHFRAPAGAPYRCV